MRNIRPRKIIYLNQRVVSIPSLHVMIDVLLEQIIRKEITVRPG